jgi:hypothetical protein
MIIFLDEDGAYLSWVKRHGAGFVLDGTRQHGRHKGLLHRSTCADIRTGKHKHWTTGKRLKACSMDLGELAQWARESLGKDAAECAACHPNESVAAETHVVPLTRLGSNVLNYVLETSIVHLTNGAMRYRLSVADIAACLHKTPAQLTQSIVRLLEGGYVSVTPLHKNGTFSESALVRPTIAALRTLDAYAESSDEDLEAELQRLGEPAGQSGG